MILNSNKMGEKIKKARKDRGFTGERLSEMCNINPVYMRQIEAGKKVPSLPVFASICNALGASPDYLLSDSLGEFRSAKSKELTEIFHTASPAQIDLITAMLRAALEHTKNQ